MSENLKVRSDSDIIEEMMANAADGIVVIGKRKVKDADPERDYWLIDRAILVPSDTTLILGNCKIKLSDKCRDNFIRSANCGIGITDIKPLHNIRIIGEGYAVLEGADHPRATGDGSKILACPCYKTYDDVLKYAPWVPEDRRASGNLNFFEDLHVHTYGTDANNSDEKQTGDWRNVGILFANVSDFAIENIHIVESHGWGISLEACSHGTVSKITFDAKMQREIDGILHNIENQDGLDLRNGCHDIAISNITGQTGDDLVALTAIANHDAPIRESGSLKSTQIMHNDWTKRDTDIYNITIRNIVGRSQGGSLGGCCSMVRLLPAGSYIKNVVIDGIINTHDDGLREGSTLLLGEEGSYGKNYENGLSCITVSNIICDSIEAITIGGFLCDSVITNVINKNPKCQDIITVRDHKCVKNVVTSNLITAENL